MLELVIEVMRAPSKAVTVRAITTIAINTSIKVSPDSARFDRLAKRDNTRSLPSERGSCPRQSSTLVFSRCAFERINMGYWTLMLVPPEPKKLAEKIVRLLATMSPVDIEKPRPYTWSGEFLA